MGNRYGMFGVPYRFAQEGGQMANQEKYTILYGRLSQEDNKKINTTDDSNSIQNQDRICQGVFLQKLQII